ncbi:MAG TPA: fluoride efflux transporter CrcB [Burkholderiales bacterium]|nr:fluoride efflux transporter CrcB [Burkholderiales bacterium]
MSGTGFLAVGMGAALGAWLRWWLGVMLNAINPALPYGTLAANLIGGYLIGVAVAVFSQQGALPVELRLFVITGFLGGLTTFSSFSAEAVGLLMQSRFGWASLLIVSHLAGSIAMTLLGIFSVRLVTNAVS